VFTRHILIVLALCSPCSLLDRRHARSGPLLISTMFSAYNLYYYLYSLPHSSTGILCVNFLEHNAMPAHNRYLSLATIIVPPPASLHICAFVDILLKCIARRKALRRRGANQTPKRRNFHFRYVLDEETSAIPLARNRYMFRYLTFPGTWQYN
jgi:hypothetical protein